MHVAVNGLRAVWQLARPRTLILIWLHAIFAYGLITHRAPEVDKIGLVLVALTAWYINAVAINDLSDQEVDAINLKPLQADNDRPLLNRTLDTKGMWVAAIGSAGVMVASCLFVTEWLAVVAIGMVILNLCYSLSPIRISARGGLAQMLLPVGYVLFPSLAALAVTQAEPTVMFVAVSMGLALLFMGRLFLKDVRDEIGDRETGKLTYLVRHGLQNTLWQSGVWVVIGMLVMSAGLWDIVPSGWLVLLLAAAVGVAWAMSRCLSESNLECRLLYVAIVGRIGSGWLFCCLLVVWSGAYELSAATQYVLLIAAAGMFVFGIITQMEGLRALKRSSGTVRL